MIYLICLQIDHPQRDHLQIGHLQVGHLHINHLQIGHLQIDRLLIYLPQREVAQDLIICIVPIQPRKHVLDHAGYRALLLPTRQHELDHTDHPILSSGNDL